MARRKKVKQETKTMTLDVPIGGDLSLRLEKLSKLTGLSSFDLIQKWILQEESMAGLLLYKEGQGPEKPAGRKSAGIKRQRKTSALNTESADYRKKIVKRISKLKKEGMTLKKIAETFNDENIATVSGSGKWYTSSITWLLRSV